MKELDRFFNATKKDLNGMVDWKTDAPVAEFWESFDAARAELAALRAKHDALQSVYDAHIAKAQRANFGLCGCEYCVAMRGEKQN